MTHLIGNMLRQHKVPARRLLALAKLTAYRNGPLDPPSTAPRNVNRPRHATPGRDRVVEIGEVVWATLHLPAVLLLGVVLSDGTHNASARPASPAAVAHDVPSFDSESRLPRPPPSTSPAQGEGG